MLPANSEPTLYQILVGLRPGLGLWPPPITCVASAQELEAAAELEVDRMALGGLWRPEHSRTHSERNARPQTWIFRQGSPSRGATLFAMVWETAGFKEAPKAPDRHTALQMTGGLCDALEWATHATREQRHRQRKLFECAKTWSRQPIQNGDDGASGNGSAEAGRLIGDSRRWPPIPPDHA